MITPNDHVGKTRDALITLNELHHLYDLLTDKYEAFPPSPYYDTVRAYNKDLAMRLIQVWFYWSKRTNDTERFTLTIKR